MRPDDGPGLSTHLQLITVVTTLMSLLAMVTALTVPDGGRY